MKSSKESISIKSIDYEKMMKFGKILSKGLLHNRLHLIYLKGELGSGKTSLVRAIMRGLGISEKIPSPSFSIAEIYKINKIEIIHIDMFRIAFPEAWRTEEIRSYLGEDENLIFLEWPDKASLLPNPDLLIELSWSNPSNPNGPREIKISGNQLSNILDSLESHELKKLNYE